jgi:hypothetical protein
MTHVLGWAEGTAMTNNDATCVNNNEVDDYDANHI